MGRPRLYATRAAKDAAYYQRKKAAPRYPPLPLGPYRVLYADPPWQYRNRDPHFFYHADTHYATLSIAELCALPVRKLVAPKAVLFLWVTSPMLGDYPPVLKAWGFTYKASIVWDKETPVHGAYIDTQHEFLLWCTRGSCKPLRRIETGSVWRERPQAHSAKPPGLRRLIDYAYQDVPRLELFARQHTEGWDAWGHEVEEPL